MILALAEAIILTTLGNEYLKKGELKSDYFNDKIFQFCQNLSFGESKGKLIFARNPLEWFERLEKTKCQKLRLINNTIENAELPGRILSSFQGGSNWLIEAVYLKYSDLWIRCSEIEVDSTNFDYVKIIAGAPSSNVQIDREEAKLKFLEILDEIYQFAQKNELDNWAKKFDEARYALKFQEGAMLFPSLIPAENYDLINHQLMLAVNYTDIFGGMGSWNDVGGFESKKENDLYKKLSDQLYQLRNEAILAAVNHDRFEEKN